MNDELTRPYVTEELVWFSASAFMVIPIMFFWNVWKARNNYIFDREQAFRGDTDVVADIRELGISVDFRPQQPRGHTNVAFEASLRVLPPQALPRLVVWARPAHGRLKLNVDGCSKGNPGPSAAGGVIRDEDGRVGKAFGRFFGQRQILYAELHAILIGLELATELGFDFLEVETDSARAESLINSTKVGACKHGDILARIRQLCITNVLVRHVYREANQTADFMANWTCLHETDEVLHGDLMSQRFRDIITSDARHTAHIRY